MDAKHIFIIISLLAAIVLVFYSASFTSQYTNWDDDGYVKENPVVKDPGWESIKEVFKRPYFGAYQPLIMASFIADKKIGGMNPAFSHSFNVVVHLLNTLLVFWLLYVLGSGKMVSFVTAAFFAAHPLHVESVAWVTERKDLMYTLFFLLSTVIYVKYTETKKIYAYLAALILFLLSLLSKGMAVVLPGVLLLIDHYQGRKFSLSIWAEKVPFIFFSIVFGIVAIKSQHVVGAVDIKRTLAWSENLLMASYGFLFYPVKMIFPAKLSSVYPAPVGPSFTWPTMYFLSPVFGVLLMLVFIIWGRRSRLIFFGVMFYLITITPVLRLIPFGIAIVAADRFFYVSSIGLLFILSALIVRIRPLLAMRALVVVIIALWGGLTYARNLVWKDSLSLWTDVLKKNPGNYLAYSNLGNLYYSKGVFDSAIYYCSKAIAVNSNHAEDFLNRGCAYKEMGLVEPALSDFNEAISLNPEDAEGYNNRGLIYEELGFYEFALNDYNSAISLDPLKDQIFYNRGNLRSRNKQYELALADYRRAIALNPQHADAYNNLGIIAADQGKYQEALTFFNKAIAIDPGVGIYYLNRAKSLEKLGEVQKAQLDYDKAKAASVR